MHDLIQEMKDHIIELLLETQHYPTIDLIEKLLVRACMEEEKSKRTSA